MKVLFTVVVGLSSVGVMGQGTGTSTNAKSYRAYTTEEQNALTTEQKNAIGVEEPKGLKSNPHEATPDVYSQYNSFKFAQPNNYATPSTNNLGGDLRDGNSPGFETETGERYKTWQADTWKDTKLTGEHDDSWQNGEGYARREQHKDITKTTNPSELDSGREPAWNLHGVDVETCGMGWHWNRNAGFGYGPATMNAHCYGDDPFQYPCAKGYVKPPPFEGHDGWVCDQGYRTPTIEIAAADKNERSGTIDYVYDEEDNATHWATLWAQEHYYPRSDYNDKGERDPILKSKKHYPLDDDSMGLGGDASYRHHHQELHQNGRAHYSHGLFPELHLDETHRYFMDGEAWPRTENEYRYSFKKWGNGYRAGTLVKEMNLDGLEGPGKDVHKYQWGGYDEDITRGNQPSLFADKPNGGDQEVYTPLLDYSWTATKYTALDAHTENLYQKYINSRPRLNGDDTNPAVKWSFDRLPYEAGNPESEITDLSTSMSGQTEVDMSVTSNEEDWDMKNSGLWGWDKDLGTNGQWKGWTDRGRDGLIRKHALPNIAGDLQTQRSGGISEDNNGLGDNNPHKHNEGLEYAVGPTGHGLTTAVGDRYGWNTDRTYGYGKLDTYRTWNMKGRKV